MDQMTVSRRSIIMSNPHTSAPMLTEVGEQKPQLLLHFSHSHRKAPTLFARQKVGALVYLLPVSLEYLSN